MIDAGGVGQGAERRRSRDVARASSTGSSKRRRSSARRAWSGRCVEADGWRSPVAKFLSDDELAAINERSRGVRGRRAAARRRRTAASPATVLGGLRTRLAERLGLIPDGVNELAWIVDWPLFEWNYGRGALGRRCTTRSPLRLAARPRRPGRGPRARLRRRLERRRARRRLDPYLRSRGPAARCSPRSGSRPAEAEARFGFLLGGASATALRRTAASPTGSTAWSRCLHGTDSIRDVIAFPKAASGGDPLTGAPAPVDERAAARAGRSAASRKRRLGASDAWAKTPGSSTAQGHIHACRTRGDWYGAPRLESVRSPLQL